MVTCLASEQSGECPTVVPSQYTGSPSLEGYQVDSLRTGTRQSTIKSILYSEASGRHL